MTAAAIRAKLDEMEAVAKAATKGPWTSATFAHDSLDECKQTVGGALDFGSSTDMTWVLDADERKNVALVGNGPNQSVNGGFIARARTAWPATVAALRIAVEALEGAPIPTRQSVYRDWWLNMRCTALARIIARMGIDALGGTDA